VVIFGNFLLLFQLWVFFLRKEFMTEQSGESLPQNKSLNQPIA
jgi:hypothetical protein